MPLLLSSDNLTSLKKDITALMNQPSAYGDDTAEGVYVRVEDEDHVLYRWKLRRSTFSAGRTDFASNIINNQLAEDA